MQKPAREGRWWAVFVLTVAGMWWTLEALPERFEIRVSEEAASAYRLRMPLELRNTGMLGTDASYRCAFRQVYDLERGVKLRRVRMMNQPLGRMPGRSARVIYCDLKLDAARPAAFDLEIIVTVHAPRRNVEVARKRYCVVPGAQGHPVWTEAAGQCRLDSIPAVAKIEQSGRDA